MKQRVIELTDFGAAENMKLIEADIPTPGPGQIVVKNKAIGLNYLDTLILELDYILGLIKKKSRFQAQKE